MKKFTDNNFMKSLINSVQEVFCSILDSKNRRYLKKQKKNNNNLLLKINSYIYKYIPKTLLGSDLKLEKYFYKFFGSGDYSEKIYNVQQKNFNRYIVVFIVGLGLILITITDYINYKESFKLDSMNNYYIEREEKKIKNLHFTVTSRIDGKKKSENINLRIQPIKKVVKQKTNNRNNKDKEFLREIELLEYKINKSVKNDRVYLPMKLKKYGKIYWSEKRDNFILIALVIWIMMLLSVYFSRYDSIKKENNKVNKSIEEELPNFINKIVLYMNSGMVITVALKTVIEKNQLKNNEKNSYFYNQMLAICKKTDSTNSSIIMGIRNFALRSENREFIRVINVISENVNKGTELVSILTEESNLLWFQRKKKAEERGKIIETKLNMPIALQLLVLVMITIAPSMLEV